MLPLGPHLVSSSSANGWKKISSPYLPRKIDYQNDGPQIISIGEEHFASPGERVSLPCRVTDLGTMVRLWKQAEICKGVKESLVYSEELNFDLDFIIFTFQQTKYIQFYVPLIILRQCHLLCLFGKSGIIINFFSLTLFQ